MNEQALQTVQPRAKRSSSKIASTHLDRLAMVYVRQSTPQQMVRHQESTRLQYSLVDHAQELGWPKERVVVIDDDLGQSGSSIEGRLGFQRLVAEVSLDHVGLVLGVEMSRLARSCRDWYQLLEVCALFKTLIADSDGIYDPANYNDRLLLGLKGTMSEAELHMIKQRMLQGKPAKARRGELGMSVPIGYVRRPSGEVIKDPDEEVQSVIHLIFDQFEVRGTIHGVLRYLVDHQVRMPVRVHGGAKKGELQWRRPNRVTLQNLLHHPIYAGAYAYGRRPTDPRRKQPGRPGTGRTVAKPNEWYVLLQDRLPAYIDWSQYEFNLQQLAANRTKALGVSRRGPSLLSGLLQCGRCGHRMAVSYNGGYLRYNCYREMVDYGAEKGCQTLSGKVLDERVSAFVLRALEPSALEVSLQVAADIEVERLRLEQTWRKRLERAQYEVDRAMRQYNEVEPENRLVARTLESQLETKLVAQKQLQNEYDRVLAQQPTALTTEEREDIRNLASDIPKLWNDSTTTSIERQTILRQLVDKVEATVEGESEKVKVVIHWVGGHKTKTSVIRPVARLEQLSYWTPLAERVVQLKNEEYTSHEIATRLNQEGWRPAKRRATFNGPMVRAILSRKGLSKPVRRRASARPSQQTDEWSLPALAKELNMPPITLYAWLRRGWVCGTQRDEPGRPWIIKADNQELSRLRALRAAPKRGWRATVPVAVS